MQQKPAIEIEIMTDSLAPESVKVPEPSSISPEPTPIPLTPELLAEMLEKAMKESVNGCEDPNCPFCRWMPIVNEILDNIEETEVMQNLMERGYPVGFSLALLPDRVTDQNSISMMELVEGLEESLKEEKPFLIPATRVADTLDSLKAHIEADDDTLTLAVINDKMFSTAYQMLGIALNPFSTPQQKKEAERWYRNLSRARQSEKD